MFKICTIQILPSKNYNTKFQLAENSVCNPFYNLRKFKPPNAKLKKKSWIDAIYYLLLYKKGMCFVSQFLISCETVLNRMPGNNNK